MQLIVVNNSHDLYPYICDFTRKIYNNRVKVNYDHFPPIFVSCWQDNCLLGAIGLTPAYTTEQLTAESFFDFDLLAALSSGSCQDRRQMAEAGTLTKADGIPMEVTTLISAGVVVCAFYMGIKYLVFVTNRVTVRHATKMGWKLTAIGKADFSRCSPEMRENWKEYVKYPLQAYGVETDQAFAPCHAVLSEMPQLDHSALRIAA